MKSPSSFIAITSEGGLLPADFLHELPDPKTSIEGVTPVAYHLAEGERLNEQINRSWHRLKGCWENFKKAVADKPITDPTTTDTRERWLFPLFQELGFGRLTAAKPIEVDGRSYPVSHGWNQVPIHLVGSHADLDCRTPGAIGASKASPHSLVQSALNASSDHLWGIVSNGFMVRLLRDNVALTRLAYVEFDLQVMFDGDLYSEFFVLWLVCHQSRFEGEKTAYCWLERWKKAAEDKSLRALDDLYPGVKKAIAVLGAGLVSNRANVVLLEKLRTGRLTTQEFYKQVLRVIYRMLFLLVAEDRALLHVEDDSEAALKARRRYRDFYSLARLRALTLYRASTPHPDLWQVFQLVTAKLGSDSGCPELALPPLGSFLWTAAQSTPDLLESVISNRHFLEAVHALAFVQDGNVRRAVDYKNLGSEELGSVYQGLLEMHPRINADAGLFELDIAAGNERKTSGSYYTPDSLVQCLLDSALEPVIAERLAKAKTPKEKETALLRLKVCDKAVGSGHFLLRAAHRIARHLARVRSGEEEPSPAVYRTALRDVIGHCLYGVDINPMAVELCKVTLWLEALEPGKPLSFLDHHIRCGNSLLGTTPELISAGLPDDTFEAIEGDDKAACASLKKLNRAQREGLRHLFIAEDSAIRERMHQAAAAIDEISDGRPEDIHRKEAAFRNAQQNYDFQKAWDLANLWCAAFVIKKHFLASADQTADLRPPTSDIPAAPVETQAVMFGGAEKAPKANAKKAKAPSRAGSESPIGITTQHLRDFVEGVALPDGLHVEAKRLADQYQFFHFYLAFPEVFAQGGFDVALSNPPWERIKIEEREWFGARSPDVSAAATADQRKTLIRRLLVEQPELMREFHLALRQANGTAAIISAPGLFPIGAAGDLNTFSVFADLCLRIISPRGRAGLVTPTSLITDYTYRGFFTHVMTKSLLRKVADFSNKNGIFPGVDSNQKFCLLTFGQGNEPPLFSFGLVDPEQANVPGNNILITVEDIRLVNPNTETCPAFQSTNDAALVKLLYGRVPVLKCEGRENAEEWDLDMWTMFHMANDSNFFVDSETESIEARDARSTLRLYEGKTIQQFDHRFSDAGKPATELGVRGSADHLSDSDKLNPHRLALSRYHVSIGEVQKRAKGYDWFFGYREIAGAVANIRTMAASVIPLVGVGNKILLFGVKSRVLRPAAGCLLANLNSFVFDYILRQKMTGTSLSFYIVKQIPALRPSEFNKLCQWAGNQELARWLLPRVLELTYTAWDLEAFAQDCGWSGPPFRWDEERRLLLRCELDAAFFHLYLGSEEEWRKQPEALTKAFPSPRHAVDYILDTFPIVKRKDEAKFNGDYRTKRVILEIYDALAEATQTGQPYQTRLNPPPADPRCCHPPKPE